MKKIFFILLFSSILLPLEARRIYLTRHGQVGNLEKENMDLLLGEQKLTPLGRMQAKLLGEYLRDKHNFNGIILSSPLLRTTETACIAAKKLNKKVLLDPGLQEINPGRVPAPRGMTLAEAENRFPGMTLPGKTFTYPWRVSNEPREARHRRYINAFDRILKEHPGDLLLVTHAGGVSDIVNELKKRGNFSGINMIWNCSLFIFETDEKDTLLSFRYVTEFMTGEQLTSNKHRYKVPPSSKNNSEKKISASQ